MPLLCVDTVKRPFPSMRTAPKKPRKRPKLSFSIQTLSTLPMTILSAAKPILPSLLRTVVKKMWTRTLILSVRIVRNVRTSAPYAENVCTRTTVKIKSYQALNLANQIRLLGAAPNTPNKTGTLQGYPIMPLKARLIEERSF